MFLNFFIARKIHDNADEKNNFSRSATSIALIGVLVGVAVIIISLCVAIGFKKEIISKVVAFGGNAQIVSLAIDEKFDAIPIVVDDEIATTIDAALPQNSKSFFATKLGILKNNEDFCSINLKGVNDEYDMSFFRTCLISGYIPHFCDSSSNNEILISQNIAQKLHLDINDHAFAYFHSSSSLRARKFKIAGIYNTNLTEFDKNTIFTDIHIVRKLNGWDSTMVSGCEIRVANADLMEKQISDLKEYIKKQNRDKNGIYGLFSIKELTPQIFSWLDILDANITLIMVLMLCVSSVTVASGLIIVMLERVSMIGTLKSLGASNTTIRHIFIIFSAKIILKGILLGNVIAISLCYLQKKLSILSLDPSIYYIDTIPIEIDWTYIILIDVFTFLLSLIITTGSTFLISIQKPVNTVNFE